ncbi:MAG: hypothetical protein Q8J62_10665 [Candidatus Cloacimonadaceae bacterium]|nr:hypothetical protein [Candidatus Cloacimonadaceae bacterium]
MTAIENYSQIIDNIFGNGTTSFSKNRDVTNHVIGALNHSTQFKEFNANFIARLHRLRSIYSAKPQYLKDIIVQVNEIASEKNWEGAFAELAAYDHLNSDNTYIVSPIKPNVTLFPTETYAKGLGKDAANLDGYIEEMSLYFDIKCFKDNVTDILEGIYKELKQVLGRDDYTIRAEYQMDIAYEDFKGNRRDLLLELGKNLKPGITYLQSKVVQSLKYRILWGKGVLTTQHPYNPYRHAENYFRLFFNYANKFVLSKPTIIVMVVFPWFNHVISNFQNSNEILYRSLSRRFFCQFRNDKTELSTFNSKFKGNESLYQVSNSLSGIVFLEDDTILSNVPDRVNVKSYVYLNPNASNPIQRTLGYDYIRELANSVIEDFEHDNY